MRGQKCKFFIIIKNRGTRRWAVIGQSQPLGDFLMDAGGAHQIGMLGADYGNGAAIFWLRI